MSCFNCVKIFAHAAKFRLPLLFLRVLLSLFLFSALDVIDHFLRWSAADFVTREIPVRILDFHSSFTAAMQAAGLMRELSERIKSRSSDRSPILNTWRIRPMSSSASACWACRSCSADEFLGRRRLNMAVSSSTGREQIFCWVLASDRVGARLTEVWISVPEMEFC
jgi:hypothetical protein